MANRQQGVLTTMKWGLMMKIIRAAVSAAIVLTSVGVGGTAFAGEWRPGRDGDERYTPVKDLGVASSECAFSGRDEPDGPGAEAPGPEGPDDALWMSSPAGGDRAWVQSPGQFNNSFLGGPNAAAPGDACRGNL